MFDRIMDLPAEVRRRYECRSLRFAAAHLGGQVHDPVEHHRHHHQAGGPVITRRKFDPEATLDLIDRHRATGLVVVPVDEVQGGLRVEFAPGDHRATGLVGVPVMFDRIMDLPAEAAAKRSDRHS
ncbi:hypothetical protein MAHJHV63_55470 [Mycobacterium avium subsp. hominissuis]